MTGREALPDTPAFCNFEGSQYRSDFWEGQGREYEDAVERIALRRLIPPSGERIIELGAGFGRLVDLYAGYRQVILLDYARSMLQEAQERLGNDPRFIYIAGNIYNLPLADGAVDTAVMVRVLHHLAEPPVALREIRRIVRGGGDLILEYANKRNLKAILRYLIRPVRSPRPHRSSEASNPFSLEPWEFVSLNFDYHPRYIEALLRQNGFSIGKQRSVSLFRIPALKRAIPLSILVKLDGLLQAPTAPLKPGPSIFLRAHAEGVSVPLAAAIFRCPSCHVAALQEAAETLLCGNCGARWSHREEIYDFRSPLSS